MLRLRGGWTVVDPAVARKAPQAADPHGQARPRRVAAALTGVVDIDDAPAEVVVGASLLDGARAAARRRHGAAARRRPPGWRPTLRDYQRQGFTWLDRADRRSASAPAWPTTWGWARPSP